MTRETLGAYISQYWWSGGPLEPIHGRDKSFFQFGSERNFVSPLRGVGCPRRSRLVLRLGLTLHCFLPSNRRSRLPIRFWDNKVIKVFGCNLLRQTPKYIMLGILRGGRGFFTSPYSWRNFPHGLVQFRRRVPTHVFGQFVRTDGAPREEVQPQKHGLQHQL